MYQHFHYLAHLHAYTHTLQFKLPWTWVLMWQRVLDKTFYLSTNVTIRSDIPSTANLNTFLTDYKYLYIGFMYTTSYPTEFNLYQIFIFVIVFAYTLEVIWDPIVHSTHWLYLLLMNVGLKMVYKRTETCCYTKIPTIIYYCCVFDLINCFIVRFGTQPYVFD